MDGRRRPSMPLNSALTRFIKQGLSRGVCPLCRVAYKVDGEWMWAFFDEYSGDEDTMTRLERARGFCPDHAERLRRLEVEGLRSNLGISGIYLDVFHALSHQLAELASEDNLEPAEKCPACAFRDEELARNARYLIEELESSESSRNRFASSDGLCLPHFELTWRTANGPHQRELLLDVQRRAVNAVVRDLVENVRKQGQEYRGDPDDREASSWQRAIHLTAGWSKEALRDDPPEPGQRYELPHFARVRPKAAGGGAWLAPD
jgi:hypothetical protein